MIGYLKAGLLCTCLALFLNVIPAAIPYWWQYTQEGQITQDDAVNATTAPSVVMMYGAIRWCHKVGNQAKACFSYDDPPKWLTATFVLLFVAIGTLAASAVVTVLFINMYTRTKVLCLVATVLILLGVAADVAAVVVFAMNAKDYFVSGRLYAAFGVPIGSVVFAIIAAILIVRNRNAEHKDTNTL